MAGIGIRLNRIFSKRTITTDIVGFGYSAMTTVTPTFVVIGAVIVMELLLKFNHVNYYDRELFACTMLYIFVFALLSSSPFNAVISRYLSDVIYNERYEDIMPCFNLCLFLNIIFSSLLGIPFCIHEYLVGGVWLPFVVTGYLGYISLVFVFYSMLYLSICKDYIKISWFFFIGMTFTIVLSLILVYIFNFAIHFAMLISLTAGFFVIAVLEMAVIRNYFRENSREYKEVLRYFRQYWKLIFTNFLYTLGLYIHNFVFWHTELRMELVKSFICCQPYDMATCIAMFTNISATVIFIARTEMNFHERYKAYSEAVIGGRGIDIDISKQRMFRQLSEELMNLLRIQFIVAVIIFLLCEIFLPRFGFGGMVMRIYPLLAAGYFVLYFMYSEILYLYYFDDLTGSVLTSLIFCLVTFFVSIFATNLSEIYYGLGVVAGSLAGWTFAYLRLHWVEKNLDSHVFCRGSIIKDGEGAKPSSKVFDRYSKVEESEA